jgi:hypothetical protein
MEGRCSSLRTHEESDRGKLLNAAGNPKLVLGVTVAVGRGVFRKSIVLQIEHSQGMLSPQTEDLRGSLLRA